MPKTCNTTELRQHAAWFGEDDEWYVIDDKGNHYAIVRLLGMKDGKPRLAIRQLEHVDVAKPFSINSFDSQME